MDPGVDYSVTSEVQSTKIIIIICTHVAILTIFQVTSLDTKRHDDDATITLFTVIVRASQ